MNGPHDLGGRHGFGPVRPEDENTRFHADWEGRVLGLTLAAGALGYWNIDASRHTRENLPSGFYLSASYYQIWLRALENLLQTHEEISAEELASGQSRAPGHRQDRRLTPDAVAGGLAAGSPANRSGPTPVFSVGDRVRTLNHQPAGHTRLPGYAREREGTISAIHGAHVFPDTNAHFQGEDPCPLYTVVFEATELFGADADPDLSVSIDAWERYLEPA